METPISSTMLMEGPEEVQTVFAPAGSDRLVTRILVPIDFSTASLRGFRSAVALARATGASIHVMHVVEPPTPADTGPEHTARTSHVLARLAVRHSLSDCGISSAAFVGKPAPTITRVAGELGADFIIVPTAGRSGLRRVLLGSVADHLIRCAPCPVMVLPSSGGNGGRGRGVVFDPHRLRKILAPVDFSVASAEALRYAERVARFFGASITLLHCLDGRQLDRDSFQDAPGPGTPEMQLVELLGQCSPGIQLDVALRAGSPGRQIPAFAREHEFDLIVSATHGRSGFKRAILGSTSDAVIRRAPCPTLTLNEWSLARWL
jgi:nucleotide-binding universal stress UspA family protein